MADTGSWIDKIVDNRYKVLEKIGQGGFGEVYKARHLRMDRTVALKLLRVHLAGEVEHLKRFEQEAKAASRINHPNAVVVYDSGQAEEGVLYIAMEYVEGVSLKHVLKEAKTLPPERVVRIIKQICSALAEAHRMGVVHRDLKPENIMICSKAGQEDVVKVLDFGIAKIISEDAQGLTQTGVAFGTPRYMSPEQCEGKPVDWRADIYALGCIIYEMLSGRPPFEGEVTTVMFKHVTEEPRPLREVTIKFDSVTEELEKVVLQALQKQRENRQSAEELARELEHAITIKVPTDQIPQAPPRPLPPPPPPPPPPIQAQVPAPPLPTGPTMVTSRPRPVLPWILLAAFGFLLVAGVGGYFAYTRLAGLWRGKDVSGPAGATAGDSGGTSSHQGSQTGRQPPAGSSTNPRATQPPAGNDVGQTTTTSPVTTTSPPPSGSSASTVRGHERLSNQAVDLAASGQLDQAERLLAKAIESQRQSPELHFNLAQVFIAEQRFREAIEEMNLYLQLSPNAPDRDEVEAKIREISEALQ